MSDEEQGKYLHRGVVYYFQAKTMEKHQTCLVFA